MSGRAIISAGIILALLLLSGCGAVKEREVLTVPPAYMDARTATLQELVELVNRRYAAIDSLTVSELSVEFTGGSIEEGYFEKYRKARGYLVAERPESIFVNILNPLTSSSVLVMASRNDLFQIWIPSRNQFVRGDTGRPPDEENPIYNVRPEHLLQGILIDPVGQSDQFKYYVEETQDPNYKYYVLGVLRSRPDSRVLRLYRKIWIERSRLELRRQQFFAEGRLVSDIEYGGSVEVGGRLVSTAVSLNRPMEHYEIRFDMEPDSVQLNREVRADAFTLTQPPGSELVVVEEG